MAADNNFIYLDNNATTPLDPRVLEAMMPYMTDLYGNASSSHRMGKQVKRAVDEAREAIGDLIDSNPEDIYYMAGATEAINLALRGVVKGIGRERPHIITVSTEHPAVLDTSHYLESVGVEVTYLGVDRDGLISLDELRLAMRENTVLVCVMLVNNETGVIQPIGQIADVAHEHGALFMSDATQAMGKLPINVLDDEVDLLAFSGHKFYGPKGIGGLYVNPRLRLSPLVYGGGHERGLRSGTLNVPGIVGLGTAAQLAASEMDTDGQRVGDLAQQLENALLQQEGTKLNGSKTHRLYNTVNICFEGMDNEALLLHLKNVCVSNGSACHSFTMEPSRVLLAMGLGREKANASLRFSLGRFNTEADIATAIQATQGALQRLKALSQ